ncbi:MAG: replication-associated recombination protein A [Candidatus Omnitrophica bacterium]|nr:replication-associated recombination protein A [Candidatus Omnitrophota bacterium]
MESCDTPLAVRMRPRTISEFVGQAQSMGEGKLLRRAIRAKRLPSVILWGPSGCGKTTLGILISQELGACFEYLNAAFATVTVVKRVIDAAKKVREAEGRKTCIFIDEIHRFNKLQQEALIPDTELGTISFVGATIYNPSYYLIPSLISRSVVAAFKPLSQDDLLVLMRRALSDNERGLGLSAVTIEPGALEYIATIASGDARRALNALEVGIVSTPPDTRGQIVFTVAAAQESIQRNLFYDKKDTYHYDTISAFIKSIRGSDPDSALFWLAKMLAAGEDPRFIARRLVILASEDIGNAEPMALVLTTSCFKAVEFVGRPEADLNLAQTTIYCATCPKSNSATVALMKAKEDVARAPAEVPEHLKPHSKGYKYPHNFGGYVVQDYGGRNAYYTPTRAGYEKKIKEFLSNLREES